LRDVIRHVPSDLKEGAAIQLRGSVYTVDNQNDICGRERLSKIAHM
jgi:hypothetical protein